jgi:hypothetical protein
VHRLPESLPVLAVEKPAAQGVHESALPAVDLEVPIGQTVQASVSVSAVAPAFANLPAGQVFAVKVRQADGLEAPVVDLYVPEAQRVQDVWPVKD